MDTENLKTTFKNRFNQTKSTFSQHDWLYKVLEADDTVKSKDNKEVEIRYQDKVQLKVLPFELVENSDRTVSEIWDEMDGLQYDDFYLEWQKHLIGYWQDKIELLDMVSGDRILPVRSPLDVLEVLNTQIVKIKKRALIIDFQAASYVQKQKRPNGDVEYNYIRGYWYDNENNKTRTINKLVGDKYDNFVDRVNEFAPIYRSLGYIVSQNVRLLNKNVKVKTYDLIIERDNVRKVVDMNIDRGTFNNLIILNEMINQFKKDFK